ncbi:MAG: redoxin domain-containing protein [Planctomycetota bacterium]
MLTGGWIACATTAGNGARLGAPAPAIDYDRWLRPAVVDVPTKGPSPIRVVQFFAGWSEPCVRSIPMLSELQTEFAAEGVELLAVTAPDTKNSLDLMLDLLERRSGQLDYGFVWDADGSTLARWLGPDGQRALPVAFVTDREGRIVYRGHPRWLRAPIEGLVQGDWDLELGNAALARAEAEWNALYRASGEPDRVVALARAFRERYPRVAESVDAFEFEALLELDRGRQAATVAHRMIERGIQRRDALLLNNTAWSMVDPYRRLGYRDLDLAYKAARTAVSLTAETDPYLLDTLARVHAWRGEFVEAHAYQTKAVALAKDAPGLVEALDEYRRRLRDRR